MLIDRTSSTPAPGDVERIFTLDNLPALTRGSPIV
jgi:hypothetical protein